MPEITVKSQELLIFPLFQQTSQTLCEKCKVNLIVGRWNVCLTCLKQTGNKALFVYTICIDCFKSPTGWLYQKTYMERTLRAKGLSEVRLEMSHIQAGQFPVCEIRRSRKSDLFMIMDDDPCGSLKAGDCPVSFDEYVEIQARVIVAQMVFKRQNRLIEQQNRGDEGESSGETGADITEESAEEKVRYEMA